MSLSGEVRPSHDIDDHRGPKGRLHDQLRQLDRRIKELRGTVTLLEDQRERVSRQLRRYLTF